MPELAADSSPDASHDTGGSDRQGSAGTLQHIRALAMPFIKGSMVTEPDGSLLIKDVPMLAVGIWTDSAQRTPMEYTDKMLEESTGNWLDNTGWSRHLGGAPRDITDKVAEAINPHYGQFTDKDGNPRMAELADIRIFPHTQKQRDTQELVRHGLIKAVSVEHYGGDERLNSATRRMEASSIYYTGWAFVNKGACTVCTLPRLNEVPMLKKDDSLEGLQAILQSALDEKLKPSTSGEYVSGPWIVMTFPDRVIYSYDGKKFEVPYMIESDSVTLGTPIEVEEVYVEKKALELFPGADPKELMAAIQKKQDKTMTDTKELEDKIATLTRELEAVKAQKPAEVKIEIPKELSELPGQMKELAAIPAVLKAMSDRLDALEKSGTPKTAPGAPKELSEAEPMNYHVSIDRKAGTIRAV